MDWILELQAKYDYHMHIEKLTAALFFVCIGVWIVMKKLKLALARDHLRGLAATKEISLAILTLAIATMIVPGPTLVASVVAIISMITAYITSRLFQGAREHQDSIGKYVRNRWENTKFTIKSTAKRFFKLAAPDGWRKIPNTVDGAGNVASTSTTIRIVAVTFIATVAVAFFLVFVDFTGLGDGVVSAMLAAVISYNMLAISCLLTVSVFIYIVFLFFLQQIGFLRLRLGFFSSVRCIVTWIGYGGAIGAMMASFLPFAVFAVPILTRSARSGTILKVITPRWMLDFPAVGAVAGYALGLIVAMASLFPECRNSWCRRFACPGLFVVFFVVWSHILGGPRGLLQPVIDDAALRSGFNNEFCTSVAPTDIASRSIDAKAWVITELDRCDSGFLISTTTIGWIVGIAAFLVGVILFANDIRVRARSKECRSGDSNPVCPAPPQR